MIHTHEITIGSLLRTNEGEIIRVEGISSKTQNRKVGYHRANEPTYMRYVRLAQCEGIELTQEILKANGWKKAVAKTRVSASSSPRPTVSTARYCTS